MVATVYQPQLQVTLIKLVRRQNGVAGVYSGSRRTIDLTPMLGDAGAVRTAKAVTEAAGGFSISFADQIDPSGTDTVYALAEPMDMIEIRASRTPEVYAGGKLPLIMRGFVTRVQRVETMGVDGRPQRVVVVNGHDAGLFFQINAFIAPLAYVTDKPLLTTFQLQAATGLGIAPMPVGQFITQLVERVINARISLMSGVADHLVPQFTVAASVPDDQGQVIPSSIGPFQGQYWNLVEFVADKPWNEAWTEDTEAGPVFHFRPAPYTDISGQPIMPGYTDPGTIDLDIEAVVRLDMMRANDRIANFFWVPPGYSQLETNGMTNVAAIQKVGLDQNYANDDPRLYGVRQMEAQTRLFPSGPTQAISAIPAAQRSAAVSDVTQWFEVRATQLKLMNRDNSVFEEGSIIARGSETLLPGRNLLLTRGDLAFKAYVIRVEHTFLPLRTWTTSLLLERGTGFLERNRFTGTPSPYWAEGRRSPMDAAA